MIPSQYLRHSSGFSLVELVVGMTVLAIIFTLVETVMFPLFASSVDPMFKVRSVALGQAYIEEIMGKRFDELSGEGLVRCNEGAIPNCTLAADLGPEAGETRDTYDDVDDYQGLDSNNNVNGPQDATGATRSGYSNFRVQVSVVYDNNYDGTTDSNTVFDAKLIKVTVTDPRGDILNYAAYRGNF